MPLSHHLRRLWHGALRQGHPAPRPNEGDGRFVVDDLTERRRATEALQESEQRYALLAETVPEILFTILPDGYCDYLSRRYLEYTGLTEEEALGFGWVQAMHPEDREANSSAWREALWEGTSWDSMARIRRSDGVYRWFIIRSAPMRDATGRTVKWFGVATDIEDRKRSEEEAHNNYRLVEAVIESTTDMVVVKDLERRYVLVNSAAARLLGRAAAASIGLREGDLLAPETAALVREADSRVLSSGRPETIEVEIEDPVWRERRTYLATRAPWRNKDGTIIGIVTISRDITPRKRTEKELRQLNESLEARVAERTRELEIEVRQRRAVEAELQQAQKMEAVGQLTGGIAHDFNNVLTVVTGNLERLESKLADQPGLRLLASAASRAAQRAERLTSQLLAFSRKQRLDPRPFSLHQILSEMGDLLRRTIDERRIVRELADDLPPVMIDRNQLEAAMLNLLINARDATSKGGDIAMKAKQVRIDEVYAADHPDAVPGEYVELVIADSGVGMAPEVLERAFEPFFTTKEVGKGTGLGLSMVYGFIRQSGGHIRIDSKPGIGTAVHLYLPLARDMPDRSPPQEAITQLGDTKLRGSEKLLIVEDDETVREYTGCVLRELGYTVVELPDGDAALDLLAAQQDFALIISDLVMPGKHGGAEVAAYAARQHPPIEVMLTSGYASQSSRNPKLPPGTAFLAKPYRPAQLAAHVRAILDRQQRARPEAP